MAITAGNILQVTLTTHLNPFTTNPFLNVFWFEVESIIGTPGNLNAAFVTELWDEMRILYMDDIRDVQTTNYQYDRLDVVDWTDATHPLAGITLSPLAGLVANEVMPTFVAWGFRLNRSNSTTRNGQKRFGGVPEIYVEDSAPVGSALTILTSAAGGLGTTHSITVGSTQYNLQPAIVRKDPTTPFGILASQWVQDATFTHVTTQNTRKNF